MRRRLFRWRAGLVVAAVISASCARKAAKPASRQEALAACVQGCLEKADQRRACDQLCGCIIDEMFQADGLRRKDPTLLPEVSVACVEKLVPKPPRPSAAIADDDSPRREPDPARDPLVRGAAMPRPGPDPRLVLGTTLVTGKGCGS